MSPTASLMRDLVCTPTVTASLSYYSPASRQAPHFHEFTQVSFLLAGELVERQGRREYALDRAAKGYKPAGVLHEDLWGAEGALVFSLKLPADHEDLDPEGEPGWSGVEGGGHLTGLARTCLLAEGAEARQEAVLDLLALPRQPLPANGSAPPAVARAREAIRAAPEVVDVESAAREAGVHRVHFSRLFQRSYGYAPSVFRRRVATSRAVAQILEGRRPLNFIAIDNGFSDQAHLTRTIRGVACMPPAELRRFLEATQVQARTEPPR